MTTPSRDLPVQVPIGAIDAIDRYADQYNLSRDHAATLLIARGLASDSGDGELTIAATSLLGEWNGEGDEARLKRWWAEQQQRTDE